MVVKQCEKDFQGILYAARAEIARRGMKFTMDSLARRLRISKKTLYQSISSKQELIERVMDSALQSIVENEACIFQDPSLSYNEQLVYSIELYRSVLKPFDKETMLEMLQFYPEQWDRIEKFRLAKWQSAIETMRLGISKDEFPGSYRKLLINGILLELLMPGRQSGDGSRTLDNLLKELTDLFKRIDIVEGVKMKPREHLP
jgi:AcrR family transcriptional regulator